MIRSTKRFNSSLFGKYSSYFETNKLLSIPYVTYSISSSSFSLLRIIPIGGLSSGIFSSIHEISWLSALNRIKRLLFHPVQPLQYIFQCSIRFRSLWNSQRLPIVPWHSGLILQYYLRFHSCN